LTNALSMQPASMAAASNEAKDTGEELRRGGDGGNIFLTCLRIRFEERGSWSKALADPPDLQDGAKVDKLEGVVAAGCGSPTSVESPKGRLQKDKSGYLRRLNVPMRSEEESSSSNSSPSPRKMRSKLCSLAFGYASETVMLQQSDTTSSRFWGRALGGNDVAAKHPCPPGELAAGGLATTANPLRPLRGQISSKVSRGLPSARAAYYFELEILETDLETTSTVSLGFCFVGGKRLQEPLPLSARELPGAFMLGGELPKAHFGSTEIGSSLEWRPLIHVQRGSRIGGLLEVRDMSSGPRELPILRFSIFQDGTLRTEASICSSTMALLTQENQDAVSAAAAGQRPFGLVEVAGNVRSLKLCPEVTEPPLLR